MIGNLNELYQLRQDRLRRLRDRFRRGEIHEQEFRDLLGAEGIISPYYQDIEIMASVPGMQREVVRVIESREENRGAKSLEIALAILGKPNHG